MGSGEDRAVGVSGEWAWRMGCYLKGKVGTEIGSEMKGNVCAEGNFCLSEVIFLPFQEEFKQSFFCVISKYNFGRRRCQMRGM